MKLLQHFERTLQESLQIPAACPAILQEPLRYFANSYSIEVFRAFVAELADKLTAELTAEPHRFRPVLLQLSSPSPEA